MWVISVKKNVLLVLTESIALKVAPVAMKQRVHTLADVAFVRMGGLEAIALFLLVLLISTAQVARIYVPVKRIIQRDVTLGLEFVNARQVGPGKLALEHVRFTSLERSVQRTVNVEMVPFVIQLMETVYVLQGIRESSVVSTVHKIDTGRTVI